MEDKSKDSKTGIGNGVRYNQGKLRYDLVEPRAHRDMVKVLTYGAKKYAPRNWENGMTWTSIIASAKRHLAAIEAGEDYDFDPDCEGCKSGFCEKHSGELHIANLACNAHFLNTYYYTFPQGDDRRKRYLNPYKIGFDIDGVLADFTNGWSDIYTDTDREPTSWYYDRNIKTRFDEMRKLNKLNEFFLSLKPLIDPYELKIEPHCYITSRPVDNWVSEKWLDVAGFPRKKVITVEPNTSKVQAAKDAGIDIFIDDSYDNFVDLNNNGVFCYLFTTPYNIKYDVGHMRLNHLNDIPVIKM